MLLRVLIFIFLFQSALFPQSAETVLAKTKSKSYTSTVLSPEARESYRDHTAVIAAERTNLLSQMVADGLLKLEARSAGSTPGKLISAVRAKVPEPSENQVLAVYNANRPVLGSRGLDEVRKDIVAAIKHDPEQKAVNEYIASLQTKWKYSPGKDINSTTLKATDVLATFGQEKITFQDFENANRIRLNDFLWHQYEDIRSDLEIGILNDLIEEEAKARNTDSRSIIASEVTDKMRTFADGEREELEMGLMKRLFQKYEVKILLKEPPVVAQNVSPDDDPATGPAAAPVTVVMFSDFQCPACARTHPLLRSVIQEYGDKVKFVVRDYPLETIHENAVAAAKAANAAAAQGKYFEYIDLLYRHQSALDAASLKKYAADLGLNARQFDIDFNAERSIAEIRKDAADGDALGVSGTPTIFVNGVKVHRLSPESFRRSIERALAK